MSALVTVHLFLDVTSDADACDLVNEILRVQQRPFTAGSGLIDYAVSVDQVDDLPIPDDYQESDWLRSDQLTDGDWHGQT